MKSPDIAKHRAGASLRQAMVEINQRPFAEVDPAPSAGRRLESSPREGVERLYVPLSYDTEAIVEITIKSRGLGHIDPSKRSTPTAFQLDQVAHLLSRRIYRFSETAD